ncbi:MAG: DNA translocase FtsK 4TM domain-containing protein, partial [Pseudomonadota bacterium]|nr:DNA translocase FtsK 4TM domain-containing protein [Pseudomonadota bacterium]
LYDLPSYMAKPNGSEPLVGSLGIQIADALLFYFGYGAFLMPCVTVILALQTLLGRGVVSEQHFITKSLATILTALSLLAFIDIIVPSMAFMQTSGGGLLGFVINAWLNQYCNTTGSLIILSGLMVIGLNILVDLRAKVACLLKCCYDRWEGREIVSKITSNFSVKESPPIPQEDRKIPSFKNAIQDAKRPTVLAKQKAKLGQTVHKTTQAATKSTILPSKQATTDKQKPSVVTDEDINTPPLELLHKDMSVKAKEDPRRIEQLCAALEARLLDYGVQCSVKRALPGPVITRYELELAAGTKASKVSGLAKDLARSLSVQSVRVIEVIPGNTCIGVEIPNHIRQTVNLRDVLESKNFQQSQKRLCLAMGVDISGDAVVADLCKMPHLLVAGTTGSGKSVGLNGLLLSLLYKLQPDRLRLILIDPKMLEFAVYDGIPHLLTPVVTDMKDAASALHWCVNEMERRYKLMSEVGVRNIDGYNAKMGSNASENNLPYIVVIVDEFADMMMMVGKKVEQLIARLAQKARASGIHLILATQRPSVDVITGLIKANIPSRMSFQVSSKIDSRTIIDQQGAEALLGSGDLLFVSPGSCIPMRCHGAYVADDAVAEVVSHIRKTGEPEYIESIIDHGQLEAGDNDAGSLGRSNAASDDKVYDEAVSFVIQSQKASISGVQRRMRIGYNRAATLVEKMEKEGIVSSMDQGGQRKVLVAKLRED